jgi:hypothetical protein
MKGSFTHINNKDTRLPKTKKKGLLVAEEKNNVAAKKRHPWVHSPPMVHSIIPPFPLLPTLSKKGIFLWGGRGNNDNGALKDIQGAFTSH